MALRTKAAAYFSYLMNTRKPPWRHMPVLLVLRGFSWLYKLGVTRRYQSFVHHPERVQKLPVPVISIGNITVGGTGKTPMTCHLVRYLQRHGYKAAILNRGYRSAVEETGGVVSDGRQVLLTPQIGGDEACLMARSLSGVPVLVGKNRYEMGKRAVQEFTPQVIFLDDGFQHWSLYRDLDIVLIDATNPIGNRYLLPRGILREPLSALERAQAIILTKVDQCQREELDEIRDKLRQYNKTAPIAEAVHSASWCISFADWLDRDIANQSAAVLPVDQAVTAVSALGNPESFEYTVQSYGYILDDVIRYDDHHQYTEEDLKDMQDAAEKTETVLVTTEKDAVKMPAAAVKTLRVPLYVLGMDIEIIEGKEELKYLLHNILEDTL